VSSHKLSRFGCAHPKPFCALGARQCNHTNPVDRFACAHPKGIASPPEPLTRSNRFTSSSLLKNSRLALGTRQQVTGISRCAARAAPSTVTRYLMPVTCNGGADRDRTDDPLVANQVLSQLSYSPLPGRGLQTWWVWVDLNHRPHAYQACALTN
jgi:hypothetical protein